MNKKNYKRPFSSSPSKTNLKKSKKNLRILSACVSSNEIIPKNIKTSKYLQNSSSKTKYKLYRPKTTKFAINRKLLKSNLFSISENELDSLNLIINSNPNQYNNQLIKKKMRQINPLFLFGSDENLKRPKLSFNTDEVFYKYNLLYANKTQNLIKTYSPKMRPASSSIGSFLKKMKYNLSENISILNEEEMIEFAKAKCKDIGIELRENILFKFKDYCKLRCKNRVADLSDSFFGINSMKFLTGILYNNDRISRLNLAKNNFGDEGIELLVKAVKDSISLVSLDISSNAISYKGGQIIFSDFINQKSIINLNISSHEGINRNRLTSKGIKNIIKFLGKNLYIESLNLSGNSLKNEGFDFICRGLNNNISLQNLNISNNDIQETGINQSIRIIKTTKLYSINLSNNPILDEGIITFAHNLRHFPELRVINISNCGIEFNGFKELLKILQSVRRIESLDISKNRLTSSRFDELKTFFCAFGIKYLNMSKCQLGDDSAYTLGECLMQNETIKKINLSNNKITDIGFKSFVYLFNSNSTIEYFDCSSNFITDKTMKDFLIYTEYNHTLKYLNLYDNQLRNDVGKELLKLLDRNKTLLSVNLLYNRVQLKTIDEINQKLKANNEKEKAKYVPDLMRKIRDLEFDPILFKRLIKQIKSKNAQQISLSQKVKEDNKNYNILLSKDLELVEQEKNNLKKVNDEVNNLERKISHSEKNISLVEENLIINERQIKGKINEATHELGEIDIKNMKLKAEYDLVKRDLDDVIRKTRVKYMESQDKVLNAQKILNEIQEKFINLNNIYDNMMNPDMLVPIYRRESSKRKTTKRLKLRRFSTFESKKSYENNNILSSPKKINENKNNNNLLNIIHETDNVTTSTSPTMPLNEFKAKRSSLKQRSSKKIFQLNKK